MVKTDYQLIRQGFFRTNKKCDFRNLYNFMHGLYATIKHDIWHLYTLDSNTRKCLFATQCTGFQLILEYHYVFFHIDFKYFLSNLLLYLKNKVIQTSCHDAKLMNAKYISSIDKGNLTIK